MSRIPSEAFIQLEREWYAKLKESGFRDIECTSEDHRPLKQYTCLHQYRASEATHQGQATSSWPETLFRDEESFFHHSRFREICERICSHGNHSLEAAQCSEIWVLHIAGESCRSIAAILNVNYVLIFRIKRQLTEWMNLIATEEDHERIT